MIVMRDSVSLRVSTRAVGHRLRNFPPAVNVRRLTVWAVGLLLRATTYSRCSAASMRLNAYTPALPLA